MFSGFIEFITEDFAWFEGVLYEIGIDLEDLSIEDWISEFLWF